MDKAATGAALTALRDKQLLSAAKLSVSLAALPDTAALWREAVQKFGTADILIKPQADGCSAGVARLASSVELGLYLAALRQGEPVLAAGTLTHQPQAIELPVQVQNLILEPFIITDAIRIEDLQLRHSPVTGWIELTVGVTEHGGHYHALSPSITVAQHAVLSLEEKFQGGTGVNLTPPPAELITAAQRDLIKIKVEQAAAALGIEGYARIDIFFNTRTEQVMVIEANSLPGLTASTVIFHQALAEQPAQGPVVFLAQLVAFGKERLQTRSLTRRDKAS